MFDLETVVAPLYRERSHLLALLAAEHPRATVLAPDPASTDRRLLYLHTPEGQLSWHITLRDLDLMRHVETVPATDPRARWDGHSTTEKYARIRRITAAIAAGAATTALLGGLTACDPTGRAPSPMPTVQDAGHGDDLGGMTGGAR